MEAIEEFQLENPIVFLDEVQRLENPGILLKGIIDLRLPIKMIASGSSQLEIKSRVQEYLTGRHIEAKVLPFSCEELGKTDQTLLVYGCYPTRVWTFQVRCRIYFYVTIQSLILKRPFFLGI